ncbi:MAG: hypothetical protein FJ279_27610 [Planctomycetes bacterium]|nr:hypothetical protein [Planctomycetota bacterium]MBM4079258.1 hypothetical protein [Planctomycetota bacterium]
MSEVERLLEHYVKGVRFPEASGFEVLELLDVRSKLAAQEAELNWTQRAQLEDADSTFIRHAPMFRESLAALGDLSELRSRARASCSHWWWYLEKLARVELVHT